MSELLSKLLNEEESNYLDFKKEWYSKEKNYELLHDILCLSNSTCKNKNRYLIIGVDDNKKTHKKTLHNATKNMRTAEDITQFLQEYMSKVPSIIVYREFIKNKNIYIIQITPNYLDLPYVLNKPFDYKIKINEKYKPKKLIKNCIYSRVNSMNTPKDESCDIETVKEIIKIQNGDNLDIIEKFKTYILDTENWKVSGNNYYYKKNHNFKMVRVNNDENIRRLNSESYIEALRDTFISKDYWDHRDMNSADDYFTWFDIELYADNTLIKKVHLFEIFAKYYFADKDYKFDTFYLPTLSSYYYSKIKKTKEYIKNTFEWNLCKILFKCSLPIDISYSEENAAIILDNLNYEFLENPSKYIDENKSWIYGISDNETKISK